MNFKIIFSTFCEFFAQVTWADAEIAKERKQLEERNAARKETQRELDAVLRRERRQDMFLLFVSAIAMGIVATLLIGERQEFELEEIF